LGTDYWREGRAEFDCVFEHRAECDGVSDLVAGVRRGQIVAVFVNKFLERGEDGV